ncbi:hypothetical protein [Arvimicrobium flavum]|uniref:hypothetical protein n=1 Tax=Arvimicrobium flavum TaxID=3393320 RepID=UPI00237B452B|nr:hypothetical protein [Mesorhizobium shangrilense]
MRSRSLGSRNVAAEGFERDIVYSTAAYALDDQLAMKAVDGVHVVVSEGSWDRFDPAV